MKLLKRIAALLLLPSLLFATPVTGQYNYETVCTNSVAINTASATTVGLVTGVAGTNVYVCGFLLGGGGTATIATLEYGSGATCSTPTAFMGGISLASTISPVSYGSGTGAVLVAPVGTSVCVVNSASQQLSGFISYSQY